MHPMPRPQSENTFQVAIKVPQEWVDQADAIAAARSRPGLVVTRTDAIRAAIAHGLETLSVDDASDNGDPLASGAAGPWTLDAKHLVLRHRGMPSYDVDLERMSTAAQVLDWLMHMCGRSAVSTSDLGILVRLIRHLLDPQSGMCGGAMSNVKVAGRIDPAERVRSRLTAVAGRRKGGK